MFHSFNEIQERMLKLNGLYGVAKTSRDWYGIDDAKEVSVRLGSLYVC